MDYIVDLRKNSETFKKWIKIELNSEKNQIIYVPHGFGHGFLSMSDDVKMSFKIDQYFNDIYSRSINYKDPEINLNIKLNEELISDQDKNAPFLNNSDCNLWFNGLENIKQPKLHIKNGIRHRRLKLLEKAENVRKSSFYCFKLWYIKS